MIAWLLAPGWLDRPANSADGYPFEIFPYGPTNIRLTWTSVPGSQYVVQVSPDLGPWVDVDVVTATGVSTTWIDPFPRPPKKEFYRITLSQRQLTSIEPAVVSTTAPTTVYFLGQRFDGTEQLFVDGSIPTAASSL